MVKNKAINVREQQSFHPAKIISPLPPSVLIRTRLFKLLDESLKHPVTWVSGQAAGLSGTGRAADIGRRF